MIDYNLYGMNHICLSAIKFRLGEGQKMCAWGGGGRGEGIGRGF